MFAKLHFRVSSHTSHVVRSLSSRLVYALILSWKIAALRIETSLIVRHHSWLEETSNCRSLRIGHEPFVCSLCHIGTHHRGSIWLLLHHRGCNRVERIRHRLNLRSTSSDWFVFFYAEISYSTIFNRDETISDISFVFFTVLFIFLIYLQD